MSKKLYDLFGEPYLDIREEKNFNKYADIASSAQLILEHTMKNLIQKASDLSGKRKIVLTGGVALNCKMIHNLSKQSIFEELIVPPSPGDSGSAVGAANFAFLEKSKNKTLSFNSIFLGPKKNLINKKERKDDFFLKTNLTNDFIDDTTNKLMKGEIIASYYGFNEVGPRSLGNTSIFCEITGKRTISKPR